MSNKLSIFLKYLELINEEYFKNIIHVYKETFQFDGKGAKANHEFAIDKMRELRNKKNLSLILPEWEDLRRYFHHNKRKFINNVIYLTDEIGIGFKVVENQPMKVIVPPYGLVYALFQHKKGLKSNALYSINKKIKKFKNKKK